MKTNTEQAGWCRHIVSTPDVLSGKPRIDGTRIPVALILGHLATGKTYDEVIGEFPDLKREDIAACLDYARDLTEYKQKVLDGNTRATKDGSAAHLLWVNFDKICGFHGAQKQTKLQLMEKSLPLKLRI